MPKTNKIIECFYNYIFGFIVIAFFFLFDVINLLTSVIRQHNLSQIIRYSFYIGFLVCFIFLSLIFRFLWKPNPKFYIIYIIGRKNGHDFLTPFEITTTLNNTRNIEKKILTDFCEDEIKPYGFVYFCLQLDKDLATITNFPVKTIITNKKRSDIYE